VIIPKGSRKLDWEVELAFVIGRRASYVSEADALNYVFGYMVCNDVSNASGRSRARASGSRARAPKASGRSGRGW
jgi:2-keto-4-pentenoate hydratase/2-oxohepta-3-ene-1,7-dioic acid hydratase in catechol pathway